MKSLKFVLLVISLILSSVYSYSKQIPLQIIYTSDEHGWMLREGKQGGAAEMYEHWLTNDSIKHKNTLILSGGDNLTGPAVSTYTKGMAMIDVMNAMGYQYSALGNHEFDFGKKELTSILSKSKFKYLSANVSFNSKQSNLFNNLQKYSELNINGLKVFILGLSNIETPNLSSEKNISGFQFDDYLATIDLYKAKIKHADISILLTHICAEDLTLIHSKLVNYGFDIVTGGHCHTPTAKIIDNVPIIEGAPYLSAYTLIPLIYNTDTKLIDSISAEIITNNFTAKNRTIDSIITKWNDSTKKTLNQAIGYSDDEIPNGSAQLMNLILNSWRKTYPEADLAITNRGSIRQGIPKGDISISTIIGIMPFDNDLIVLEMTGKAIRDLLIKHKPYISGLNMNNNFTFKDGSSLIDSSNYKVIINSFIYNGGDKYDFRNCSKLIIDTGINMRTPLIDFIRNANTSWNRPINSKIDSIQYHQE